jgi:hypothetical protein
MLAQARAPSLPHPPGKRRGRPATASPSGALRENRPLLGAAYGTVTHCRLFFRFPSAFCGTTPPAQLVAGFWFTVAVNWIWMKYPGGSGLTAAHEAPLQDQSAAAADGLKTRGPLKLMEPEGLAVSEIWVPTGHGPDPALLTVTTTVKTAGLLVGCMDLSTTRSHIPAGVEVAVGEGEGVAVAAGVGVGVRVAVGEDVGVFVTVGDGVGVRVAVGGGVGIGVQMTVGIGVTVLHLPAGPAW